MRTEKTNASVIVLEDADVRDFMEPASYDCKYEIGELRFITFSRENSYRSWRSPKETRKHGHRDVLDCYGYKAGRDSPKISLRENDAVLVKKLQGYDDYGSGGPYIVRILKCGVDIELHPWWMK